MLLDIVRVQPGPHYTLTLEFENGEKRRFNMEPYMEQKPWLRIKSAPLFQRAFVENGTVAWPGNVDIDPETLYDLSVPVEQ
jgi:peptidase E